MTQTKTIHVISGTHWDREWRFTAEQSLLRLAELIDELLDVIEENPDYSCFLLDGGTITIEDYLNVRPENESRLKSLMQAKRIQMVMWYTLPEMSTVSPESLIRNLLYGKRMADKYGGAINAGYTATSYGQISQLAQIYSGFGMKSALSYRGTNKHQVPPICKLQSPDGTWIYHIRCFDEVTRTNWFFYPHYMLVLGKPPRDLSTKWDMKDWPVHMADKGLYETAFQMKNEKDGFNNNPQDVKKSLRMLVEQASPQMINDQLLALDMEDNAVPYSRLPEMVRTINDLQTDYQVIQSSLDEYVNACLDGINEESLPVHKGEMRYTLIEAGFNGLLGATHSSRVDLKLLNDSSQRQLINVAEPLSAMSAVYGGCYEHTLLDRAWLYLLKNHAHDSICGAAIHNAHLDNPFRFRAATSIAKECSRKACEDIWVKMDTAGSFKDGDLTLTFFNTLPIRRKYIEEVTVDTPRPDFGGFKVEACTGVGPIVEGFDPDKILTFQYFDIIDVDGNKIPYTILERENIDLEVERKLDTNAAIYDVLRNKLLIEVDLPPMGYCTYAVRPRLRKYNYNPAPTGKRAFISLNNGVLENEYLRVQINPNGTFDLTNKETGKLVNGLHYFCDNASTGNAHKHKTVTRDSYVTSLGCQAILTLLENNTQRAVWQIDVSLAVPACADRSSSDRSSQKVTLPIATCLTLEKGSRLLKVKTVIENTARDHQLRVLMPTEIQTDYVYADAPFDIVKRNMLWKYTADNMESHQPCQPMQRFVSVCNDKEGVSFITKGQGEYEVIDDEHRTLAVTLLRATRTYMRANRGPMTPTELERNTGSQCLGTIEHEYAIYMHAGCWKNAETHLVADDFRTPVHILQGVPKPGDLPVSNSLLEIEKNNSIHLSAFYKSEKTEGYILRLWNSADCDVQTKITFNFNVKSIQQITMDEESVVGSLETKKSFVEFSFRKKQIVTFMIKA